MDLDERDLSVIALGDHAFSQVYDFRVFPMGGRYRYDIVPIIYIDPSKNRFRNLGMYSTLFERATM